MLDYIALGILVFAVLTMFYGIIVIHDIPYEIAARRNHPQRDAIHVAGWVSLLTLHVLWPFLWIWATLYREDRGWGFSADEVAKAPNETISSTATEYKELAAQLNDLQRQVESLAQQLNDQQKGGE